MELQVEQAPSAQWSTSVLCDAPRIALAIDAVSTELAESLIGLAEPRLQDGLLSGSHGGVVGSARTCQVTWLSHGENPAVRTIVDIMAAIAGLPSHHAERLQVIRYSQDGQYRPHFDSYDLDSERGRRCTAVRGQRTHTALLYLNDGFSGGATVFPRLGLEVRPRQGAVLTFDNCRSGSALRDDRSLHAGAPVEQGEKWAATLWFRER